VIVNPNDNATAPSSAASDFAPKPQTFVNGDKPRIEVEEVAPGHIDAILSERGSRYGKFTGHATVTQQIKDCMQAHAVERSDPRIPRKTWDILAADQREALEMIAHKIGRILNGDPDYIDSWDDIAGYAKLVADRLRGNAK
jgi:hypothetical protein